MNKPVILFIFILMSLSISAQDSLNNTYKIFYYPNGTISSEGIMVDGKPDGWWKSYTKNSTLYSEGNRKNFLLDSLWKFYDDNGKITLIVNYKNGLKNGNKIQFFDNEFVVEYFINDTLSNSVNVFYLDSSIKKSTPYLEGKPHGIEKEYDKNGNIVAVTNYYRGVMTSREFINRTDKFGFKQGKWKYFWENGNLKLEGTYQNSKRNGYFKYYDQNGQFEKVDKFVNDELIADADEVKQLKQKVTYHPNGKIAISVSCYRDIPQGIRREYDSTGKIIKGYVFKDGIVISEGITDESGLRQGLWREFYETGELRSQGYYINSNQTGKWNYYFQDKSIEIAGEFNKKGEKTGNWIWYYPNGSVLISESWEDGKREGESEEFDEYGNTIVKGNYVYGDKDGNWYYKYNDMIERGAYFEGDMTGNWKLWYGNGTLAREIEYDQNIPNGKFISYWENGNVKISGKYKEGMKDGIWNKFDENGNLILTDTYKEGQEIRWNDYILK